MDILLFLGSGISYKSNLPDIYSITNSIFLKEWHKHTNQAFYAGPNPNPYYQKDDITPKLKEFLNILKTYSDKYFQDRRGSDTTYEDLFYICKQISDNEDYEIDNPVVQMFIEYVSKKSQHLFRHKNAIDEGIDLSSLASYSLTFINCVVHNSLYTNEKPIGLDLIHDLSGLGGKLDIATLNHDLLIESELQNHNLIYVDGFGQKKGDVRWFEPDTYNNDSIKIALYKLHGSINWWRFREKIEVDKKIHTYDRCGLALHPDNDHCKNERGIFLTSLDYTPVFLAGTYNKLVDYNFGIIRTIQNKFEDILCNHNLMIMSGYGWNDRGINAKLFEWILSSSDRRLLLLHENPEEKIKKNSKSAMWHRYDDLVRDGRLIPIKKWFSDITLSEILQFIQEAT